MANGRISYWKVKIISIERQLAEAEEKLAQIVKDSTEAYNLGINPSRSKIFFGKKNAEHQIRYWKSELAKAKKALYRRAKFVIHWHDKKMQLEKDLYDYDLQLEKLKLEASEISTKISLGKILNEKSSYFMLEYSVRANKIEAVKLRVQALLDIHMMKKPTDSISEAILIVDEEKQERALALADKLAKDIELRNKEFRSEQPEEQVENIVESAPVTQAPAGPVSDVSFLFPIKEKGESQ